MRQLRVSGSGAKSLDLSPSLMPDSNVSFQRYPDTFSLQRSADYMRRFAICCESLAAIDGSHRSPYSGPVPNPVRT